MAREFFCAYHSLFESLMPFGDAECGRIFRAALKYSATGESVELSGNERFLWPTIKGMIDRDRKMYEAKCRVNRENGRKAHESERCRPAADAPQEKEEEKEEGKDEDEEKEKTPSSEKHPQKVCKHAHGTYGWVKLSEEQYGKLMKDLGKEELERCIAYVDEQAQKSGNRNQWKDWDLVIRSCSRDGWGLRGAAVKKKETAVDTAAVRALFAGRN